VLFEGNLMTASEIAKKAEIARSSAYDILKNIYRKKAFVMKYRQAVWQNIRDH
jgi:sugar-specific transcriptional regulator TrmB